MSSFLCRSVIIKQSSPGLRCADELSGILADTAASRDVLIRKSTPALHFPNLVSCARCNNAKALAQPLLRLAFDFVH